MQFHRGDEGRLELVHEVENGANSAPYQADGPVIGKKLDRAEAVVTRFRSR